MATILTAAMAVSARAATRNPIWLVSPEDAARAASALIEDRGATAEGAFVAWKDARPGKPVVYTDCSGDPAAYCYPVLREGRPAGYAVVSARRYAEPIQEFSTGAPPHEVHLKAARDAAEAALGEGRKVRDPSFVYAGPLTIVARFPAAEPTKPGETVLVALRTRQVLAPDAIGEPQPSPEELALTRASWAALFSGKAPEKHPAGFRELPNVARGPLSCAADAAALTALFSYWGIRKEGETDAALCADLAAALKDSGQDIAAAASGAASARGKTLKLERRARQAPVAQPDFTACRIEVGAGRPFLVRAGAPGAAAWTIASGYLSSPSGRFLRLGDLLSGEGAAVYCNWDCFGGLETLTGGPR